MKPTSYLFLDFDGVLHPGLTGTLSNLPLLETWLQMHPHVRVVVSSSWRFTESLERLRECFIESLRDRIVGVTPDLGSTHYGSRQLEVEAWLRAHASLNVRFAALDDEGDLFRPDWPWLVLTNKRDGLQDHHLDELNDLLA